MWEKEPIPDDFAIVAGFFDHQPYLGEWLQSSLRHPYSRRTIRAVLAGRPSSSGQPWPKSIRTGSRSPNRPTPEQTFKQRTTLHERNN
jgi:hypothetical protein